jgi:hypothetical protein
MTSYFWDGIKEVTVVNGVVLLEFTGSKPSGAAKIASCAQLGNYRNQRIFC